MCAPAGRTLESGRPIRGVSSGSPAWGFQRAAGYTRIVRYACLALVGILRAQTFSNPPLVDYITYLPGSSVSYSAVDSSGYLYFSGVATSPCSLPVTTLRAADGVYGSITKLRPNGTGTVWTACLPGAVGGLALDGAGNIYVASNENGALIVTKLPPDASRIIYSTSILAATSTSLAVDQAGNAYIVGAAALGLPTTPGAYEPSPPCSAANSGCTNAFVAKLGAAGAMQYATYYGDAPANALAADSHGEVWVTGTSPVTVDGSGSFVGKLDANGHPLFSTGFGGGLAFHTPTYGGGMDIVVDAQDSAYAVGYATTFVPTTPGTIQPSNPAPDLLTASPYIVKFDTSGKVVYGTYLEGETIDAVAVDAAGNAYLSVSGNGPTPQLPEVCGGGYLSASLMILNADASEILSSRSVAGRVFAISQDGNGGVYVAGATNTTAFLVTPGAYLMQPPFDSSFGSSGFAAKFDFSQPAVPAMNCLVNAASLWAGRNSYRFDGSVAPGELVTLFGSGFPPDSNLSVTFDGVAAPILYADTVQINAVVPFKTGADGPFTLVSINSGTQVIGPYQLPVAAAVPEIFGTWIEPPSLATSGNEQAAALNQDGTVNSSTNPAAPGSVVSIFATGAGAYSQAVGDGTVGPMQPPFPVLVLGVGVLTLSPYPGTPAQILFVGQAPGLVAGVVQVNFRIPDDAVPGALDVAVYFGNYSSTYPFIFVGNQ